MHFSIFRYNPERDEKPYMQDFHVELEPTDLMLLDVILRIKDLQDDSLTIRKSCREGVCGSDAININGRNGLACVTRVRELKKAVGVATFTELSSHSRPGGRHDSVLETVSLDQAVSYQQRTGT